MSDDVKQRLRSAGVILESLGAEAADALDSRDREIERLEARVAELEREREEQIAVVTGVGPITCVNGKQHDPAHKGCLYCGRDAARAEAEALRKDAERGRFLIDHWFDIIDGYRLPVWLNDRSLRVGGIRAAIDAAREGGK
jgi:hypothetical protein